MIWLIGLIGGLAFDMPWWYGMAVCAIAFLHEARIIK